VCANVGRTGGPVGLVGAGAVERKPVGSTATTGDLGGAFPSGNSRSGVRERPSESLKLFSRGIAVQGSSVMVYFDHLAVQ
jgi:hypothetical protein